MKRMQERRIEIVPRVRRRANREQGEALETLGHAVEYLVDSRLFLSTEAQERDGQQAVQILMRLSRAVFTECAVVEPLRRRMGRWLAERLPLRGRPARLAFRGGRSR